VECIGIVIVIVLLVVGRWVLDTMMYCGDDCGYIFVQEYKQ